MKKTSFIILLLSAVYFLFASASAPLSGKITLEEAMAIYPQMSVEELNYKVSSGSEVHTIYEDIAGLDFEIVEIDGEYYLVVHEPF